MRRENLELSFGTTRNEDVSVPVDGYSDWRFGHRPCQHTALPCWLHSVHGTVLVVCHVQPPAANVILIDKLNNTDSKWLGGAVVRALDLRLEVAGSIPAAALSSATLDKLFTHIVQRL